MTRPTRTVTRNRAPELRLGGAPGWQDRAACVGQDAGFWDKDYPDQWRTGRRICLTACPVLDQCRTWVMSWETGTGASRSMIYAGMTPDDRADLAGNHNRKPVFDRCHTCNGRMTYATDRPVKVQKQATDAECVGCWTAARQGAAIRGRLISEDEARAAHSRWVQGYRDAMTRRGEQRYQTIRKREHRAARAP